jgi:hypothetical protein
MICLLPPPALFVPAHVCIFMAHKKGGGRVPPFSIERPIERRAAGPKSWNGAKKTARLLIRIQALLGQKSWNGAKKTARLLIGVF